MKTYLASIDVNRPIPTIWGTRGFQQARVLLRSGSRPLGEIHVPLDGTAPALSSRALKTRLAPYLPTRPLIDKDEDLGMQAISVIVCTRDHPLSLTQCLDSLARIEHPQFEVVVVDNASETEQTREVVSRTGFRYVREDRPGLDWARNRGLQEAGHEIVAFIDDDAGADEYWLRGICHGFRNPDAGAVTGLVLPAELETRAQHLFEKYGNGMSKGMSGRVFRPDVMSAVGLIRAQDIGVGTNMAFRKSLLEELGGFDTALDVGTPSCGGGDLDMLHRVLAAGRSIVYEPTALVRHRHRRDMQGLITQMRNNGRSYGVYLMKLWHAGDVPRPALFRFAFLTWGRWLLARPIKKLLRRHRLPMRMLLAELRGALSAPRAYRETYRNDLSTRRADEAPELLP